MLVGYSPSPTDRQAHRQTRLKTTIVIVRKSYVFMFIFVLILLFWYSRAVNKATYSLSLEVLCTIYRLVQPRVSMWKFWIPLTDLEQASWVAHDGVAVWCINILKIGSLMLMTALEGRAPHCARVTIWGQLSVTTTFHKPLQNKKRTIRKLHFFFFSQNACVYFMSWKRYRAA